jgi:hypothetical protein
VATVLRPERENLFERRPQESDYAAQLDLKRRRSGGGGQGSASHVRSPHRRSSRTAPFRPIP